MEAAELVLGNPTHYPFLRMLWHISCGVFDRKSGKDQSLKRPFHLICHITMQLLRGGQRFLQSFWNNKGHSDELSLIEQSLPIMGSSFPIFTTFSSIPERGMKKTLNFH